MKCEIIKDLLPAYCDCVCSVETAAEIEQHTANCENCKKLLENYRSDVKSVGGEPEKPFRKIKRGIFRNKLVIAVLAILLVGILCAVGYLTYGQIVRSPNHPSFETIISSQKAKKIVEKYCEGDIDYVMENIDIYQTGVALYDNQEEVREHCRSTLADFYEKYLKGRDLNVKTDQYNGYDQLIGESGMVTSSDARIYEGNTELLTFTLVQRAGGKFIISITGYSGDIGNYPACETDINTLELALAPMEPTPLVETAIINNVNKRAENFGLFANRFGETNEEKQILTDNTVSLIEDMYCESAYYTNFRFDAENSRYLIDIGFTFSEKSSGKRVAYSRTVRLRSPRYRFEILPEFEPVIIDDGITAENREKLENLFIY